MGKIKTLMKPKGSLKSTLKVKSKESERIYFDEFSPSKELANEEFISKVIWECLKDNDTEGVIDALRTFISAQNKLQISQTEHMARSTVYETLKPGANPTLRTLGKLIHGCFS